MTETVTPGAKRLDLLEVLAGRTYPFMDVPVFVDEELMYGLWKINTACDQDPANKELEKVREGFVKKFKDNTITVHIQTPPNHVRATVQEKVDEAHPPQFNMIGAKVPDPAADQLFTSLTWSIYVTKITGGNGDSLAPSMEELDAFRNGIPDAATSAIINAINALDKGARSGYEFAIQDPSFLS